MATQKKRVFGNKDNYNRAEANGLVREIGKVYKTEIPRWVKKLKRIKQRRNRR